MLLEAGAVVDAQADSGATALGWAVRMDHIEVVQLLKKAGAKE